MFVVQIYFWAKFRSTPCLDNQFDSVTKFRSMLKRYVTSYFCKTFILMTLFYHEIIVLPIYIVLISHDPMVIQEYMDFVRNTFFSIYKYNPYDIAEILLNSNNSEISKIQRSISFSFQYFKY